jgi:hypothetical protein
MVLIGFADYDRPDPLLHDHYRGEPEHVVWSVPPQAAAALADRADEWGASASASETADDGAGDTGEI